MKWKVEMIHNINQNEVFLLFFFFYYQAVLSVLSITCGEWSFSLSADILYMKTFITACRNECFST